MIQIKPDSSIEITYGDTVCIDVVPKESESVVYRLRLDETVVFSVYPIPGGDPVIQKENSSQTEEGSILIDLTPEDTQIPRGVYVYDVKVVSPSTVNTFIGGEKKQKYFEVV